MVFLMSKNPNKHILFALGVNRTVRNTMKMKFTWVPLIFSHYISLVSPSLASHQANALELVSKVVSRSLILTCLKGISTTEVMREGYLCNLWCLRNLTCGSTNTCKTTLIYLNVKGDGF